MGSGTERACGKAVADRPSEVADCGTRWAKLQLAPEVDQVTDCATQSSSAWK